MQPKINKFKKKKMKINLVRNLLQRKVQMNRKESKRMNIWFIPGFSEQSICPVIVDWLNKS